MNRTVFEEKYFNELDRRLKETSNKKNIFFSKSKKNRFLGSSFRAMNVASYAMFFQHLL